MCGIVGRINFNADNIREVSLISMLKIISHRGPDDEGFYIDKNIGIGMRRLSIIDLEKGHQPIFNEDKSLAVICNGEIYNYRELRNNLTNSGHIFSTNSDTEVILHLFEEYGTDSFEILNGMFAFAIYDLKNALIYLVRDRAGIKPLSYYVDKNKFIFASEIKSILVNEDIEQRPDYDTIAEYLIKGKYIFTDTFFLNVKHIEPAHYYRIDSNGYNKYCYWDLSTKIIEKSVDNIDYEKLKKNFSELFKKIIDDQLMSDVKIGSYLSGGIDSSAVTEFAFQKQGQNFDVFSARFNDFKEMSEDYFQNLLIKKNNLNSHINELSNTNYLLTLEEIIKFTENPLWGITIGQFEMAKYASKHVKVILTGHGGDELWGGYDNHILCSKFDRFIIDESFSLKKSYKEIIHIIKNENIFIALYNFILFSNIPNIYKEYILKLYEKIIRIIKFHRKFRKITKGAFAHKYVIKYLKKVKFHSFLQKALYIDFNLWLHNLLMIEDKESMAFSLEDRVPFLDNRMIDFTIAIPVKYKIVNASPKYLLKKLLTGILPNEILEHKKLGFPQPLKEWLMKDKDKVYKLLLDGYLIKNNIVKISYMKKILSYHYSGKMDYHFELWRFLNVEFWFKVYFCDSKK